MFKLMKQRENRRAKAMEAILRGDHMKPEREGGITG